MQPRRIFAMFTLFALAAFLVLGALEPREAEAEVSHEELLTFGRRIAGTYFLKDNFETLWIVTITADGTWSSINSGQFGGALNRPPFSDQQGVWKRTGSKEITAKTLNYVYVFLNGTPAGVIGVTRGRFVMKFEEHFQQVSGTVLGETFAPDQDPLDPDETPIPEATFNLTFTGQRVKVN